MSTRDRVRWLNDQITAALRDQPAMSTAEVCRAICTECRASPYHHYSRVYQRLRALAKQDVVTWIPSNGVTQSLWILPAPSEPDELEALWNTRSP